MTQFKGGDSDSSDDDEETVRLREAVDPETLKDNFYSQKSQDNIQSHDKACQPLTHPENSEELKITQDEFEHDDPKTLYLNTKKILEKNKNSTKPSLKLDSTLKSLRREKQTEEKNAVISELEVTPQFQKFVGSKLDEFLSSQIKDSVTSAASNSEAKEGAVCGLKLLKRSKTPINNAYCDFGSSRKLLKPDLLAHKRIETTEEDLESVAVSGVRVLSQDDTRAWVNKFPNRVEPGIERIKKKKKKKAKKKPTKEVKPEIVATTDS